MIFALLVLLLLFILGQDVAVFYQPPLSDGGSPLIKFTAYLAVSCTRGPVLIEGTDNPLIARKLAPGMVSTQTEGACFFLSA